MWETMMRQVTPSGAASLAANEGDIPPTSTASLAANEGDDPPSGADTAESDHVYDRCGVRRRLGYGAWDVEYCMGTLFWAARLPKQAPGAPALPPPCGDDVWREGRPDPRLPDFDLVEVWNEVLATHLRCGIALDQAGVDTAIAQWDAWTARTAGREDWGDGEEARSVMSVLQAAQREGQGVIVHPGCHLG